MRYSLCGLLKAIEVLDAIMAAQKHFYEFTQGIHETLIDADAISRASTNALYLKTDCPLGLADGIDTVLQRTLRMIRKKGGRRHA